MSTVLITGASGFVGSRLVHRLAPTHDVVAMSRRPVDGAHAVVRGNFASREDLDALDAYRIDTAVHLAAELGGCTEEAALAVNVAGTRTLLRYLVDRGCTHFVLASSICANGCLIESFVPREFPIGDDHPFEGIEPYGLSKALMEELAFYFNRLQPELEITLFRLGAVLPEDFMPNEDQLLDPATVPFFLWGGLVSMLDVLDAFAIAVERRIGPGVRRINLVGPYSRTQQVPQALHVALGHRASALDLSYYDEEGCDQASLFSIERLFETYGLRPSVDLRRSAASRASR